MQFSTRFSEFWTNAKNTVAGWLAPSADPELRVIALREYDANRALAAYENTGDRPLKIDSRSGLDDNLVINYPSLIVDKGVDFLFGAGVRIHVDDEAAGARLEELWPEDRRDEDLADLGTDGGIFGDAWIRIAIDAAGKPKIVILDPSIWHKVTDPDDYKNVLAYRCQYKRPDGKFYREETKQNAAGAWETQAFESPDAKKWTPVGAPSVFPYRFSPIITCKNLPKAKSAYGRSDLDRSVLDLCKYLARVDSLIGKIVRVHASPKAVASGVQQTDLTIGVDSTIFLKDKEATLKLLEMQNNLEGALAFRSVLRQALAEISKVPEIASGNVDKVGQLSGRAMQILYGPLLKKTETKRKMYGPLLVAAVRGLLIAGGYPPAATAAISLNWGAPVPPDPKEEAEVGLVWQTLGVSTETILSKLGFDASAELEKRAKENALADERRAKLFNAGAVGGDIYNLGTQG